MENDYTTHLIDGYKSPPHLNVNKANIKTKSHLTLYLFSYYLS